MSRRLFSVATTAAGRGMSAFRYKRSTTAFASSPPGWLKVSSFEMVQCTFLEILTPSRSHWLRLCSHPMCRIITQFPLVAAILPIVAGKANLFCIGLLPTLTWNSAIIPILHRVSQTSRLVPATNNPMDLASPVSPVPVAVVISRNYIQRMKLAAIQHSSF